MISSTQKPPPDNTQHSQVRDIHVPGEIRTRTPPEREQPWTEVLDRAATTNSQMGYSFHSSKWTFLLYDLEEINYENNYVSFSAVFIKEGVLLDLCKCFHLLLVSQYGVRLYTREGRAISWRKCVQLDVTSSRPFPVPPLPLHPSRSFHQFVSTPYVGLNLHLQSTQIIANCPMASICWVCLDGQ